MSVWLQRARARHEALVREARSDPAAFVEYAFRHERDGRVLRNARFHREWQEELQKHDKVVLIAPVEHGKTQQIIAKSLHMLGNDPSRRIALISNTAPMASKLLRAVKQQIEDNQRVREVFPDLRRAHGMPWHETAITVERPTISKDPSIQVCGVYGPLVGSRLDVIILDDVLDFENTRTEEQRKKLIEWFETTVLTRAVAGCKIYVIGTPWHPDDLLHVLSKRPGFRAKWYSAVENPDDPPEKWIPIWPEEWQLERLLDRYQNTSEAVFLRKYLCRTRVDSSGRFRTPWLEHAHLLGKGRTMLRAAPKAQGGMRVLQCYTGVDLGVGEGLDNAMTCLFTIAIDEQGRRVVCEIQSGRWTAPEIIDRLVDVYMRFGSKVAVENNGAQKFLVQMAEGRMPVIGLHTGNNKHHEEYGVEGLAVEFRNGLWVIPSGASGIDVDPEVKEWEREMLHYNPEAHTGDRLMASWIARELARSHGAPMVQRIPTQNR